MFGHAVARLVVERGEVACPVQRRDVSVEQCLACAFLAKSSMDERGSAEIRCTSPHGTSRELASRLAVTTPF